jgi:predicted nuclease of predicted toxin-antitoxin system
VPVALIAVQMASASSGIEGRQAPVWLRLGNSSNAALQHVLSTTLLQALELLRSGEPWVEIRPQTTPET